MECIVLTRGRVERQTTASGLLAAGITPWIVCPSSEEAALSELGRVVVQGDDHFNIGEKRAWVMRWAQEQGFDKLCMLDDDLRFQARRFGQRGFRLAPASPMEVDAAFDALSGVLGERMPHAGYGNRNGNNRQPVGGWHVGRMMYVLGYHVPTVMEHAEWGRVRVREDIDITLQLLRAGFPNGVNHDFVVDPGKYGADGGCSDERTVASSDEDALLLARLHPGLVRVVDRSYRDTPRKEVVCSWRKALGPQRGADRTAP